MARFGYTPPLSRFDPKLTKTQRIALERLQKHAARLGEMDPLDWDVAQIVPQAWSTLEQDIDLVEAKVKITLRLDESIAKFFRAQGEGYQARINHILGTYAQMQIFGVNLTARKYAAYNAALARGGTDDDAMEAWRLAK
ncbi:MAG: BrnA antitoxin family protein [Celeribacter marinus]